jgi:probable F420-dependent oxidoreductase
VQIGVIFPQTEIGADRGAIRAYVEATEALGYRHVVAYDHVLGADRSVHRDLPGPYGLDDGFHEPLVLFGWLAGFTSLELATGVLVGPQRQTVLVAKQAAEVDLLSGGGRLRLGLGIGWNPVEYEALGQPFAERGSRLEEQVGLLRRLWTEPVVTFAGRHHTVAAAGLAPAPPTRPIPVWLGGTAPAALARVGRLADGWFPQVRPGAGLEEGLALVAQAARDAGRDPTAIGVQGFARASDPERLADHAARWRRAGATHLGVTTMGAGHRTVDDHVAALARGAEALGLERVVVPG